MTRHHILRKHIPIIHNSIIKRELTYTGDKSIIKLEKLHLKALRMLRFPSKLPSLHTPFPPFSLPL